MHTYHLFAHTLIPYYLFIGVTAGILSGLLGIGGGVIIVPSLIYLFQTSSLFAENIIINQATGTSLAILACTISTTAYVYAKKKWLDWHTFFQWTPYACFGVVLGRLTMQYTDSEYLSILFAIFLILIAVRVSTEEKLKLQKLPIVIPDLHSPVFVKFFALLTGLISSLFGIGGGLLMIPYFLSQRFSLTLASGTTAICMVPIAFLGAITASIQKNIYWPAVLFITISSMPCVAIGAKLTQHIQTPILKKIFSIILIISAIKILILN